MQDHHQIGIPACFSSADKFRDDPTAITRSGQSAFVSVYRTQLADQCRSITVTWCKNALLHGLSISIQGPGGDSHYSCKLELKLTPWYFWKKHGSKNLLVDNKQVNVFWDLKSAKFNGETEPVSDYFVAIVHDDEVVLILGDLRKEAYRKTGCRPALIDPVLVSRKEHVFGKKKFLTRVKFHEKGGFHEISIECRNKSDQGDPEMEIRIDGHLVIHVKHLQWKFRGNESVHFNRARVDVYWDVHDWIFGNGLRHALFIFKPTLLSNSYCSVSSGSSPPGLSSSSSGSTPVSTGSGEGLSAYGSPDFCLFLYAWKVE